MNVQRWIVASVVVAVVVAVAEMIIHGVLLAETYKQTISIWRPESEMQKIAPLMWLGYAIFAPFFVWIYAHGMEKGKDVAGQGARFGLMLGIGLSAMSSLVWYVVLPIPQNLAIAWFLAGVVVYTIAGIACALTYRPATTGTSNKRRRR